MKKIAVRLVVAGILFGAGWSVGMAQVAKPDFVFSVDAPSGETTITCVRGCAMRWVQRGLHPNSTAQPTFTYSCSGKRCGSGHVGGWLTSP